MSVHPAVDGVSDRSTEPLEIKLERRDGRGAFFVEREAERVADLTWSLDGDQLALLHTGVSPSLRGQGVGQRLVEAAVSWARENGYTVTPLCSYARSVIEDDEMLQDVFPSKH